MTISPIGYSALIEQFNLRVQPHYRTSYVAKQGRGKMSNIDFGIEKHIYPHTYALKEPNNLFSQIEFALKHDGINLEILNAVFKQIENKEITHYLKQQPTGKYRRIIWFLYEFLTEDKLSLEDNHKYVKYVDLLDQTQYFTGSSKKSPRYAVNNNLLGNKEFCPIVRRTSKLISYIDQQLEVTAKEIANSYHPHIISRASHYLYTKETLSSYEIEREKPNKEKLARFIEILKSTFSIKQLTKEILIHLQNVIVDPRFKDEDYRRNQNYVGENLRQYYQKIHYISPKPEDVESLMSGLLDALHKMLDSDLNPVIIASIVAFGFVFIHPFEDGNGRIHRFLIHYILSQKNFTPPGIIFPISAVMLLKIPEYDRALERFSVPLLANISDYDLSDDGLLTVKEVTKHYYQYVDYTFFAEYLFDCIAETLENHFIHELAFLANYDICKAKMQSVIDMPDKLIDLFIHCVIQNHGDLSETKKNKFFHKLNENEIKELLEIVRAHMLKK